MLWCGHVKTQDDCSVCRGMALSPRFRAKVIAERQAGKIQGGINNLIRKKEN